MKDTVICIFACNRKKGLINLLNDLKINYNIKKYNIYFFIDQPKSKKDYTYYIDIKKIINDFRINKKIKIILRKKNFGINKNIINGINHISKIFKKFIILEDDLRLTKNYLSFMQLLLNKYENKENIFTITGYNFPNKIFKINKINKSNFISKRPCSWAWGGWSYKWIKVNFNNKFFMNISKNKKNLNKISNYGNDLKIILRDTLEKKIDSWAIKWTIYHILNNKYCIYPKKSFVNEEGFKFSPSNNLFRTKKFYHKKLTYQRLSNKNIFFDEDKEIVNEIKKIYDFPLYKNIIKNFI